LSLSQTALPAHSCHSTNNKNRELNASGRKISWLGRPATPYRRNMSLNWEPRRTTLLFFFVCGCCLLLSFDVIGNSPHVPLIFHRGDDGRRRASHFPLLGLDIFWLGPSRTRRAMFI
jgi:hypothetical protein